jgi:predicted secreted protein
MKRSIIALAVLLLPLLPLFSCIVTSQLIQKEYSCDDFTENPKGITDTVSINVGDKVTIMLCSNATTGFEWDYTMTGNTAVKEEDHDFEEPGGNEVGAAGTEVWVFEGTEKGTAEIQMEYSQPWEGGMKQEWLYKITIKVR